MSKKIIVFGSKGLVGSSVTRLLKNYDYEIIASSRNDTNLFFLTKLKN